MEEDIIIKEKSSKMKKNFSRGSAHGVVVISLVVTLLFALGWIFWQNFIFDEDTKNEYKQIQNNRKEKEPKKATKIIKPEEQSIFEGKRYSSLKGDLSMKVANGWTIHQTTGDFSDFAFHTGPGISGKLNYNANKTPSVEKSSLGGWGGYASLFSVRTENEFPTSVVSEDLVGDFTLNDGKVGKIYSKVVKAGSPAGYGNTLEKDFTTNQYVVEYDNNYLLVTFSFYSDEEKYVKIVEKVIKTIEVK